MVGTHPSPDRFSPLSLVPLPEPSCPQAPFASQCTAPLLSPTSFCSASFLSVPPASLRDPLTLTKSLCISLNPHSSLCTHVSFEAPFLSLSPTPLPASLSLSPLPPPACPPPRSPHPLAHHTLLRYSLGMHVPTKGLLGVTGHLDRPSTLGSTLPSGSHRGADFCKGERRRGRAEGPPHQGVSTHHLNLRGRDRPVAANTKTQRPQGTCARRPLGSAGLAQFHVPSGEGR